MESNVTSRSDTLPRDTFSREVSAWEGGVDSAPQSTSERGSSLSGSVLLPMDSIDDVVFCAEETVDAFTASLYLRDWSSGD